MSTDVVIVFYDNKLLVPGRLYHLPPPPSISALVFITLVWHLYAKNHAGVLTLLLSHLK